MAKPIAITPTLTGKDARIFLDNLYANKDKKVNKNTLLSIREDAKKLKSLFKK